MDAAVTVIDVIGPFGAGHDVCDGDGDPPVVVVALLPPVVVVALLPPVDGYTVVPLVVMGCAVPDVAGWLPPVALYGGPYPAGLPPVAVVCAPAPAVVVGDDGG